MIESSKILDFIEEVQEHLKELELVLHKLKDGFDSPDNIIAVAGTLHNIQESSSFVGVSHIEDLSRESANLLDIGRKLAPPLNIELVNILLEVKDRIAILIDDLRNNSEEKKDVQDILARIKKTADSLTGEQPQQKPGHDSEISDDFKDLFEDIDEEFDFEEAPEIVAALSEEPLEERPATHAVTPKGIRHTDQEKTVEETDEFSDIFNIFDEDDEEDFAEDSSVIDALSDEDTPLSRPEKSGYRKIKLPDLDKDLDSLFEDSDEEEPEPATPVPEVQTDTPEKITHRHTRLMTDTASLKEEIESDEYDEELFQIFIQQLQENISLLRTLTEMFADAPNKSTVVNKCSDLVTALSSSANYMGYEKLTDFYGQWIAELEMTDLQLSMDGPVSIRFMDDNIRTITEIFPQIEDVQADDDLFETSLFAPADAFAEPPAGEMGAESDVEPIAAISDTEADISEEEEAFSFPDELNDIKAAFRDEEETDEELDFEDFFDQGDNVQPEPDARRQQLFEKLSTALESLSNEAVEEHDAEQIQEITSLLQDEIEHTGVDWKLFDDYALLLKNDIGVLQKLAKNIPVEDVPQPLLQQCADVIEKHQSAVQSLGYERLEKFYSNWHDDLTASQDALEDGDTVRIDYISENIEIIRNVFAEFFEGPPESVLEESTAAVSDREKTQAQPPDDQQLFDRLSQALDVDIETSEAGESGAAFDEDVDRQLFDKLSTALDESIFERRPTGPKSIDDVISEILSGEGLAGTIPEPEAIPPIPAVVVESKAKETERGSERSIRVDVDKIDHLMDHIGELIASRSSISHLYSELDHVRADLSQAGVPPESLRQLNDYATNLGQANELLSHVAGEITESILNVRRAPAGELFERYPEMVREMVSQTGKKVELKISGEDTQLDKNIIGELSAPFLHIIGNCIEHGVELPSQRKEAGKEETATITLEAYHDSNSIVFEISDDGRGIDVLEIKNTALKLNIVTEEQVDSMSETEILRLIMAPGFSTVPEKAGKSDRKFGLDAVHDTLEKLKGSFHISTRFGSGTVIRIKIPLAISVQHTLGIKVGSMTLTVPVVNIVEMIRISPEELQDAEGIEVIEYRDAPLPVFRLVDILNMQSVTTNKPHNYILVVQAKGQKAGLVVDAFMRPRETVSKPLADYLRKESGFSGATILDDATISLVLDVATLLEIIKTRVIEEEQQPQLENMLKGLVTA